MQIHTQFLWSISARGQLCLWLQLLSKVKMRQRGCESESGGKLPINETCPGDESDEVPRAVWSAGGLSKLYKLDHQISQSDQFNWQWHCGTANCTCTCACIVFHFVLQIFERYRIICTIYVISLNEQLLQLCPTVHDVKHSLHFQTPCLGQLDKMLTELKRVACDVRWSWMMECTNMAGKWVIQNVTSYLALVSTFWPFPGPGDTEDNQDKQILILRG